MPTLVHRVAALVAAALAAGAHPALAHDAHPATQLDRWTAEAQRSLQHALLDPFPLGKPARPTGVADVVFEIGPDGRAARIALLHPSGRRDVDGAALAAVRRLRVNSPLPPELAARRQVARIYFEPGDQMMDAAGRRAMVARTAVANGWAVQDALAATSPPVALVAER